MPLAKPEPLELLEAGCKHTIEALALLPSFPWHKKLEKYWQIGEIGGGKQLKSFLAHALNGYHDKRDIPAEKNVSNLSP